MKHDLKTIHSRYVILTLC